MLRVLRNVNARIRFVRLPESLKGHKRKWLLSRIQLNSE
jgi:hypothetical protein